MYAFNNDTAIIAGNGTTILRTNDGGNTWTPAIYPAANAGFLANDIIFFSKEIGLISFSFSGSNNGFILKTTDNGQNWSPIDLAVFSDASNDAALDPKAATAKNVSIFAMAKTSSTTGFATLRWQDAAVGRRLHWQCAHSHLRLGK